MRKLWFLLGLVLWAGVFGAIYWKWQVWKELADAEELLAKEREQQEQSDQPQSVQLVSLWSEKGLPDFELINQAGEKVTKHSLEGNLWIASFLFTDCQGSCPRVAKQLRTLQDRLKGLPVKLVTITVQPEKDTPEVLLRYSESLQANSDQWIFLTGDKAPIYRLIREGFLMYVAPSREEKPAPGWEVEHTNNICLVDLTGRVRGKYNSLADEEIMKLRRDVKTLLDGKELTSSKAATEGGPQIEIISEPTK